MSEDTPLDTKVSLRVNEHQVKDVLKEALKEWLDEKFALLGKWSAGAFLAAAISGVVYFIIQANGFHR